MKPLKKLKPKSYIYLMGICGTAMASLAGLLQGQGFIVGGSDSATYPPMSEQLKNLGITVKTPYSANNLKPRPDLIIVGNVISKNFTEAIAMETLKIPYLSLPQAMSIFFIKEKKSIVVSGTHGKTTTSSLVSWIFKDCNLEPSFLIGGVAKNFKQSFLEQDGKYFIIEGDEYDTAFFDKGPKFLHYKPYFVILTGIEFDHADIYKNLDQILQAFKKLVELIPKEGLLIINSDDKNIKTLVKQANIKAKIVAFGFNQPETIKPLFNFYKVTGYQYTKTFQNIQTLNTNENQETDLQSTLFGKHNVLNNLAAWALLSELTKSLELTTTKSQVLTAIKTFKGVRKRQDIFLQANGITFIEDFAHHPTAVNLSLDALHRQYVLTHKTEKKKPRVFAVFEARSATARRSVFQKDFALAFAKADQVVVAEPYSQKKISKTDRFSSTQLVKDINALNVKSKKAYYIKKTPDIVCFLKLHLQAGDVLVIMSNGAFDNIYDKIKNAFKT